MRKRKWEQGTHPLMYPLPRVAHLGQIDIAIFPILYGTQDVQREARTSFSRAARNRVAICGKSGSVWWRICLGFRLMLVGKVLMVVVGGRLRSSVHVCGEAVTTDGCAVDGLRWEEDGWL